MATLGPQIVSESYGNLLKFLPVGEAGVTTSQVQITDGKGKVTPLQLATGSVYVSGTLSSSAEVIFSGLTSNAPGQYVSFDTSTGRLYYSTTSSIQNVVSASFAVSASHAPDDGDWTIGSTFMTASGQENVYIPKSLRQGQDTTTTADYAHAEGRETEAFTWAHAEGWQSKATANASHAEGLQTLAESSYAHTEGYLTSASGQYSHAEGQSSRTIGLASHAEGGATRTDGWWSHAEGLQTIASGAYAHAEGSATIASGSHSHTEGAATTTKGVASHAEGFLTIAIGDFSHTEGNLTQTTDMVSHAEGSQTVAAGIASHAEGDITTATGDYSHAEGSQTNAVNDYSHAEGLGNVTYNEGQTVAGKWNEVTSVTQGQDDVFAVGVGNAPFQRKTGLQVNEAGSVIMQQQTTVTNTAVPPLYIPAWLGETITTGTKGLYLGRPGSGVSHRISSHKMIDSTTGAVVNSVLSFSGEIVNTPGAYINFADATQDGNFIVFNSN